MAICFVCPGCSRRMNAPDRAAGSKTKCSKCGTAIVVPSPAVVPSPVPVPPKLPSSTATDLEKAQLRYYQEATRGWHLVSTLVTLHLVLITLGVVFGLIAGIALSAHH
jgi:hypothetical protein